MKSFAKKRLCVALCLVMVVGLVPVVVTANAAEAFIPQFPVKDEKYILALEFYPSSGNEHHGMDIYAPEGTKVYPVAKGTVIEFESNRSGYSTKLWEGNYIILEHEVDGQKIRSSYMHLKQDSLKKDLKVGQEVYPDDVIALSGNTGQSDGPHLHLEIYNVSKGETRKTAGGYTFKYYQNNGYGISINKDVVEASKEYGDWIKQNWEPVYENNKLY